MAGEVVNCGRCGALCRVAGPKNPDAKMLRRSMKPDGNCINCAVAEWFVATGLRETTDPKGLLLPHIQKQFARILKLSGADGKPAEINWHLVVEHWHLPFETGKRKPETFPVFDRGRQRELFGTPRREPSRDNVIDLFSRRSN